MEENELSLEKRFKEFIRGIFMDNSIYEGELLVQDKLNKGSYDKVQKILYRRCFSKNYVRELITNKKIPIKYKSTSKNNLPEICIERNYKKKFWGIKKVDFDKILHYRRENQNSEEFLKKLNDLEHRSNNYIREKKQEEEKIAKKEKKKYEKFVALSDNFVEKEKKENHKINDMDKTIIQPKINNDDLNSIPQEKVEKEIKKSNNIEKNTKDNNIEIKPVENIKTQNNTQLKENIEKVENNKKQLYSTDYWANKSKPQKELINLPSSNKTIEELAAEMERISSTGNIAVSNFEGIEISTKILHSREDIIDFYKYKKFGTEINNPNVKLAIRAEKNLKNRKI